MKKEVVSDQMKAVMGWSAEDWLYVYIALQQRAKAIQDLQHPSLIDEIGKALHKEGKTINRLCFDVAELAAQTDSKPMTWHVESNSVSGGNRVIDVVTAQKGSYPRYLVTYDEGNRCDWQAFLYRSKDDATCCDDSKNSSVHFQSVGHAISFCEFHAAHGRWPGQISLGKWSAYAEDYLPSFKPFTKRGDAAEEAINAALEADLPIAHWPVDND